VGCKLHRNCPSDKSWVGLVWPDQPCWERFVAVMCRVSLGPLDVIPVCSITAFRLEGYIGLLAVIYRLFGQVVLCYCFARPKVDTQTSHFDNVNEIGTIVRASSGKVAYCTSKVKDVCGMSSEQQPDQSEEHSDTPCCAEWCVADAFGSQFHSRWNALFYDAWRYDFAHCRTYCHCQSY